MRRDRVLQAWFVWGVWALSTALAFAFVVKYSDNFPYWDDFEFVGPAIEGRLMDPRWLWEVQSNHRIVLPKAIIGITLLASGLDFRVPPMITIACFSTFCILCQMAIRNIRGRYHYFDAAIPLITMHLGVGECLLRTIVVIGGCYLVLLGILFFLLSDMTPVNSSKRKWQIGLLATLLPLSSSSGLVLGGVCVLWFALGLYWDSRALGWITTVRREIRPSLIHFVALTVCVASTMGIPGPMGEREAISVGGVLRVALQALGQSFGPGGAVGWTSQGYGSVSFPIVSILVVGVLGLSLSSALREVISRTGPGGPGGLIAALIIGFLGLSVLIGIGRSGLGSNFGLQSHYAILFLPGIILAYLALHKFPTSGLRTLAPLAVYSLAVGLWVFNLQVGVRNGKVRRENMEKVFAAIRRGDSNATIAKDNIPFLHHDVDDLELLLNRMKSSSLFPYGGDRR